MRVIVACPVIFGEVEHVDKVCTQIIEREHFDTRILICRIFVALCINFSFKCLSIQSRHAFTTMLYVELTAVISINVFILSKLKALAR